MCLDLFSILSFALFCWKSRSLIPQKEKLKKKKKEKNTALNDSAALHQSKISIWYFEQSEDSLFKIGIESCVEKIGIESCAEKGIAISNGEIKKQEH